MNTIGLIKKEAKSKLNGVWEHVIVVLMIVLAVSFITTTVAEILKNVLYVSKYEWLNDPLQISELLESGKLSYEEYSEVVGKANLLNLITIVGTIVSMLLAISEFGFILNVANGEKNTVKDFLYIGRYFESFKLSLLMIAKIFLWSLLFVIPGIIKAFSYSLAPFLKYNNPDKSSKECIAESERLMKGYKGALFTLFLSFIGWVLLAVVVAGLGGRIPYLFSNFLSKQVVGIISIIIANTIGFMLECILMAYMMTSFAIFYKERTNPYLANLGSNEGGSVSQNPYYEYEENSQTENAPQDENKE